MQKITKTEIEKRIKEYFPNEDLTVTEYISLCKPGTLRCNKCGNTIYISRFDSFLKPGKKFLCRACYY